MHVRIHNMSNDSKLCQGERNQPANAFVSFTGRMVMLKDCCHSSRSSEDRIQARKHAWRIGRIKQGCDIFVRREITLLRNLITPSECYKLIILQTCSVRSPIQILQCTIVTNHDWAIREGAKEKAEAVNSDEECNTWKSLPQSSSTTFHYVPRWVKNTFNVDAEELLEDTTNILSLEIKLSK
jgi:hypothetical protein